MRQLSEREADVACGMARGLSYGQIAAEMGIAESTVRTHVHKAYKAFEVADRSTFLRAYQRMKIPWAAAVMRAKTGRLTEAAWAALIGMMLDALEDA